MTRDERILAAIQDPRFLARFWAKVDRRGDHECWLWLGFRNADGYGMIETLGYVLLAHRVSFIIGTGTSTGGLSALHSCDTPRCVNPNHLWLGTQADNVRDCAAKGRSRGGSGLGRIPDADVVLASEMLYAGMSISAIALELRVHRGSLHRRIKTLRLTGHCDR